MEVGFSFYVVQRPSPFFNLLQFLCFLGKPSFPTLLRRFGPGLRVQEIIPPPETARIVANEAFVMCIVMVGARPKGKEVMQAPRKLVAAVGVNGLEEP